MSYESATAGIKRLLRRDLFELDHAPHVERLRQESDRSLIILIAAFVERFLVHELTKQMQSLNSEEETRIFDFNGALGSFSNRIMIAQALGIIDRPTRRKMDLLREMRNAAAHAHDAVTFDTPEIREAALTLMGGADRILAERLNAYALRSAFAAHCLLLTHPLAEQAERDKKAKLITATLQERFDSERPPSQ